MQITYRVVGIVVGSKSVMVIAIETIYGQRIYDALYYQLFHVSYFKDRCYYNVLGTYVYTK